MHEGRKEMILAMLIAALMIFGIRAVKADYTLIVSTRPGNVILPEETVHGIETFEACRAARRDKLLFRSDTIWVTCSPEEFE